MYHFTQLLRKFPQESDQCAEYSRCVSAEASQQHTLAFAICEYIVSCDGNEMQFTHTYPRINHQRRFYRLRTREQRVYFLLTRYPTTRLCTSSNLHVSYGIQWGKKVVECGQMQMNWTVFDYFFCIYCISAVVQKESLWKRLKMHNHSPLKQRITQYTFVRNGNYNDT